MTTPDFATLSTRLVAALKPVASPIAISFRSPGSAPVATRLEPNYPEPNDHGRTGQVPAGCVFWIQGTEKTFSTEAADHGNCSFGSYTHGFITLEEAATKDDVGAVLESGWVDEAAVQTLPHVADKPESVVYGPLDETPVAPDVVLLRINGLGLMTLKDAFPEMPVEGKPQCHIVAMAKEQQVIAASVGCALSRSRTGMRPEEMTCVIPGAKLEEAVSTLEATVGLDRAMASYASSDAKRFVD
ncbi:MAG: DUF169 domain-containing protein [Acidobacteriota bacterium]|nr:DUF169 domain-containing protein [Acidobacteriota bacterium]